MARRMADTIQLKLRFSEALRRRIEQAALRNAQSMNAEIVERLEQSFAKDDTRDLIAETAKEAARETSEAWMSRYGMFPTTARR